MRTALTPDVAVARLASAQHGVIAHAQAIAAGLSNRQIAGRIASARWHRVALGVYRIAGSPNTWQQRASIAWLAGSHADAVVSSITAAALHGWLAPSPLPHVTLRRGASARGRVGKVHRSDVPAADRCTVQGLRATTPSRTLVDLAGVLDADTLGCCLDDAICGGLATARSIRAALERAGRRRQGSVLLERMLAVWSMGIEPGSPAEVRLMRRLDEWGHPGWESQVEVGDADGELIGRVDIGWRDERAGLEYLGRDYHGPRRLEKDERRLERLRAIGWRIGEVDKVDLLPGNRRVPDVLDAWFRSRVR